MAINHNLGFPRIGKQRELKHALEAYWRGDSTAQTLIETGVQLRHEHWQQQINAGLDWLTVGDFAWYDHVLELTTLLGVIPERFQALPDQTEEDQLALAFALARGYKDDSSQAVASEMTKWFDTNYHYIVPEITPDQDFSISTSSLFEQVEEAKKLQDNVKVVLLGPITWLYLAKGSAFEAGPGDETKLALLPKLLTAYQNIVKELQARQVGLLQLDEPILGLDISDAWLDALEQAVTAIAKVGVPVLLTTYFESVARHAKRLLALPIKGIHIDLLRAPEQLQPFSELLGDEQVLSVGVIDGRNVWRSDIAAIADALQELHGRLQDRLWLAPSCSLLHVPVDLEQETLLDPELQSWLAFATQKLQELALIKAQLNNTVTPEQQTQIKAATDALAARRASTRIHRTDVAKRLAELPDLVRDREAFATRRERQQAHLDLPLFPTTTIGSFPQTSEIRAVRKAWRENNLSDTAYQKAIQEEIEAVIRAQEEVGLDVLVHGEAERNDMVEYFGELLGGFAFTAHGWVQSYGSRCVKPPIIYGDVVRAAPMTVAWAQYAQSLTDKAVKGMLTGPVTMLQWSFVRDDQPRETTCRQISLALRDEVLDLEAAGIKVIQVDEPAIREGLPLQRADWEAYLAWAVECFKIVTGGVQPETQIHTHMCYSEFNDIMESIAKLDADVITIETSRSHMELLEAFETFHYPNQIGPGVYDIHSPLVPTQQAIVDLIERATGRIPVSQLWVNPDCGLKTRAWKETRPALEAMVNAAATLRERFANQASVAG